MQEQSIKFSSDIDLDFADRNQILACLKHIPASRLEPGIVKHATGVYFTEIPQDPFTGFSSLDYKVAEDRGYLKLDFLNVHVYGQIKNESHLLALLELEPMWDLLYERDFCSKLIHVGNHYNTLIAMPEAVTDVNKLAMFLAVIRPAKRHLIGKPWEEVAKTVWEKPDDGSYAFKHSHAVAYAHLVCVHMNLLNEQASEIS